MNDITIPEFEELRFDEARHIYILNGLEIPSVTTIMKPLSNAEYKGISESVLNRAAEKGTAVHNAAENWVKFQIDDIDPEYRGYFDAFLAWWDEKKPVAVGSEVRLYHKIMRYAGTADLIAWVDGELKRYPDNDIDYSRVHQIDREGYDSCTGAEIDPYPIYVIGETIDDGEIYHVYYMVIDIED